MTMNLVGPILAAAAGAVVGWVAHFRWARRSIPDAPVTPALTVPPRLTPPDLPTLNVGSPWAFVPEAPTMTPVRSARPVDSATADSRRPEEGLGLAREVILHLYRLGRIRFDEVARIGSTQQGMVAALRVRQGTVVRVLQRFRAAGVLEVDRRHVSGIGRRLNVYRLTSLGESIAKDLRRSSPPAPSPAEGPWVAPRTPGNA